MTNEEKIKRAKLLAKTIESIDKILRRLSLQRAAWERETDNYIYGGILRKFFSVFAGKIGDIPTPEDLDLELLIEVENFYKQKKTELEYELLNQ